MIHPYLKYWKLAPGVVITTLIDRSTSPTSQVTKPVIVSAALQMNCNHDANKGMSAYGRVWQQLERSPQLELELETIT
jgi:hypothetical protein